MPNVALDRLTELARKLADTPDHLKPHEASELLRMIIERFGSLNGEAVLRDWQHGQLR